ncbi:MAG: hypothetical protein QXI91_00300 [Candidatus Bathyarchaeia archaeon]
MPRIKRAIDYIKALSLSENFEKQLLGNKLESQYIEWTKTLSLQDFLTFNKTIQENRALIGAAQFFGKFRAYAFEEYVYRLLQTKICIPKPLQLFWGEKCLVWKKYAMEFDVVIGVKTNLFVKPTMVFDAKIELDSARLKTALAPFVILKNWNSKAKCFLIYIVREVDSAFLELAKNWIDGIFQFSSKNDETDTFINCIADLLSKVSKAYFN